MLKIIDAHYEYINPASLLKLVKGDTYWETSSGLGGTFSLKYLGQSYTDENENVIVLDRDNYHFQVCMNQRDFNHLIFKWNTQQALQKLKKWHPEKWVKE